MRLPGGRIRCETCGAVYAHDFSYHHWLSHHAPKDGKTVTLKEIREHNTKGDRT